MDPTAFSLVLGILLIVLSYSFFGISWAFFLPIALGTTIAMWIAHQVSKHRRYSARHDVKREEAPTVWREGTP
jgi:uncharacterized membrane protein